MNAPKKFTREQPVSKIALHNCFWSVEQGCFIERQLVEARTMIGLNAEKYMQKKGYAGVYEWEGIDRLMLTFEGREWLTKGLEALLKKHPEKRLWVNMLNQPRPDPF